MIQTHNDARIFTLPVSVCDIDELMHGVTAQMTLQERAAGVWTDEERAATREMFERLDDLLHKATAGVRGKRRG